MNPASVVGIFFISIDIALALERSAFDKWTNDIDYAYPTLPAPPILYSSTTDRKEVIEYILADNQVQFTVVNCCIVFSRMKVSF